MANGNQKVSLTLNPNLAAIAAANPQLQLSSRQITAVNAGNIVIVPAPGATLIPRGCLTRLYFGDSDEDLDFIEVDGVTYSGGNIRRFRETLLKAACCHICLNFCWNKETRHLTMLNLYPCSECRPNEKCGCGDN